MFDDAQRADQGPGHAFIAYFEVKKGTLGLRAPVFVYGYLYRAEGIGFGAGISSIIFHELPSVVGLRDGQA